jgi:hypothetical protein
MPDTIKRTVKESTRNVDLSTPEQVEEHKQEVEKQIKKLSKEAFVANKAKNKASNDEKKARERLYSLMSDNDIDNFSFSAQIDGDSYTLQSVIKTSTTSYIDINKLKDLVDHETFMKIIEAKKGKVQTFAGDDIAVRCEKKVQGTRNVSVSTKK